MAAYKLSRFDAVFRTSDGASIPVDTRNADYREYLAWLDGGGVPDPADPAPVEFSGSRVVDTRVRTTTATPTEIYRATLQTLTLYRGRLELLGVDAGNGDARYIDARVVVKRLGAGALMVGSPAVVASLTDAGASAWAISAAVSGADFVVTVTGAAGRTVDWQLLGDVISFTPGGA